MQEITMYNKEPRVSSKTLALGFDLEHRHVYESIQLYVSALESFGEVILKKQLGTGEKFDADYKIKSKLGERKEYWLNEYQTMFLITTFKNTNKAIQFKLKLVKEFSRMRQALSNLSKLRTTKDWIESRTQKKQARKQETKTIQVFIEYAKSQGSNNANLYYKNFTSMENATLFVIAGKFENLRDVLTNDQLYQIETADKIIDKAIEEGMAKGLPYKDIYQLAKSKVQWFASLYGKSEVISQMLLDAELNV